MPASARQEQVSKSLDAQQFRAPTSEQAGKSHLGGRVKEVAGKIIFAGIGLSPFSTHTEPKGRGRPGGGHPNPSDFPAYYVNDVEWKIAEIKSVGKHREPPSPEAVQRQKERRQRIIDEILREKPDGDITYIHPE